MRVVELSFLLEAVAEEQVAPEAERRVEQLADALRLWLLHALLLDDGRKDFPLQLLEGILMLMPDLLGVDENLSPDAQQPVDCVPFVILTLALGPALGKVIPRAILIEVNPIDFRHSGPQSLQLLTDHRLDPLYHARLFLQRFPFPLLLLLPVQVVLNHAMLHLSQHAQGLFPRALLLDPHSQLPRLLDDGQLPQLGQPSQVRSYPRTHKW